MGYEQGGGKGAREEADAKDRRLAPGAPPSREGLEDSKHNPWPLLPSVLFPTPHPGRPHLDPPYLHPRGGDVEGAFDLCAQFSHGEEPKGEEV